MKNLVLSLFLLLIVSSASAQSATDNSEIKQRLEEYFVLNIKKDFNGLLDYLHPSLYKIAPRESMLKIMEETFNNEAVNISFDTMKIIDVSAPFMHGQQEFRKINYFMSMNMKMTDEEMYENEEVMEIMMSGFEEAFGKDNVHFNADKKFFNVKGQEIMFAIKDDAAAKWLFLGYEKDKKLLLQMLIPKEVIEHFKLN